MTSPMLKRLAAPAPVARTIGIKPTTMAAVVIRIGRNRTEAALTIALRRLSFSLCCSSFANSTIRMPCLEISPMSVTSPTCE